MLLPLGDAAAAIGQKSEACVLQLSLITVFVRIAPDLSTIIMIEAGEKASDFGQI
jgi:hypothetical protein